MDLMNKNKNAFVFSFLALFLSFLIFAFASFYLLEDDYLQETSFKEARITYVDSEINYFKDIYIKDTFTYSLINVLDSLNNYTIISNNYGNLNKNYSRLNELVFEGLTNSSFDSNPMSQLENKSVYNFVEIFSNDFNDNYKGNFSFEVLSINLFDETPYYVSLQVQAFFNVTMNDNLSNWNFEDYFVVSVPVFSLDDPEFLLQANYSTKIKPFEKYATNLDWNLDNFNKTINNTYSIVHIRDNYKYTIGASYLRRLLNISDGSYKGVEGFYSFDYDEDKGGVWDSSNNINLSKKYGNLFLGFNFDDNSSSDLSSYNNSGIFVGNPIYNENNISSMPCIFKGCFSYNGVDEDIIVDKNKFNLNFTNSLTLSMWVKSNSTLNQTLFNYGLNVNDKLNLWINSSGFVNFEVGKHSNSTSNIYTSNNFYNFSNWHLITVSFNGDTGVGKIYVDGKLDNLKGFFNDFEKYEIKENFLQSSSNIKFLSDGVNYFDGISDEIVIYSKVLSGIDVTQLFDKKKIVDFDYVDSLFGKAINFDGINDYVEANQSIFKSALSEFSIGIWFNMNDFNNNSAIFDLPSNLIGGETLFLGVNYTNLSLGSVYFNSRHLGVDNNFKVDFNFSKNKNYYLVFNFDGSNKQIYINSKFVGSVAEGNSLDSSIYSLYFGKKYENISFYNGLIDEVKIYNRYLTYDEINFNYHNYNSNAKGCCNYITLIDPNKMGFNNLAYNKNVSYSSKLFFDDYNRDLNFNITLWEIKNITSSNTAINYYNYLLDDCMLQAFNVYSYNYTENPVVDRKIGGYNSTCDNFVNAGIY